MLLKRVVLLGFILCLVLSSAYLVWSHCHNTDSCEDLVNDLVANEAWSNPNIDYKVNVLHNYGKDELRPTLAAARVAWSDLHFNDVDNEFFLVLYLRQLCVEMADCQARRAAEFPKGGAIFSGAGAWGVCGYDVLGGGRDCHGSVDVY